MRAEVRMKQRVYRIKGVDTVNYKGNQGFLTPQTIEGRGNLFGFGYNNRLKYRIPINGNVIYYRQS